MGGVPIIGDVIETVEGIVKPKKTTAVTRPAETAKETQPEAKRDITRTLRRRASRTRIGRSLIGGQLAGDATGGDLSPIRTPRNRSTLGG